MDENLIGYLLDALDPDDRRQVEAQLDSSPEARVRLEQLRQAMNPLDLDRSDPEPPPDLVVRTLGHVAEYCCRDLPHAPATTTRATGSSRPLWRRVDVLVAASILFLAVGVGATWVLRLRQDHSLLACQNSLAQFHKALMVYANHHDNHFPDVGTAAAPPRNVAGLVVPILASDGELANNAAPRCPGGSARCAPGPVTLEQILALGDDEFSQQADRLLSCYAYSLGYRDASGAYRGPSLDPEQQNYLPIMADRPPDDPSAGNSLNHGAGRGQNVLYMDGHVRFCTQRTAGVNGDDIYLNKERQVGAGLDPFDTVLGRGNARP